VRRGQDATGRDAGSVGYSVSPFVAIGSEQATLDAAVEAVRAQIAFYASTPSYATLLELHGWADKGAALAQLAARGRWDEMGAVIDDAMLAEFAVEGDTLAEAAGAILARYGGLLDRAAFYLPFAPGERDAEWAAAAEVFARS
jgi:hypothetical protein